jgi:hypothetical protein
MADYRDMAAALSGGYGQDTGPITADTLVTLKNGKKASASDLLGMLKAIGSGSLSNLESLVRGGVAQVPGAAGDIEGLARMGINKSFGAGGVNVNPTPILPTTTDILGMMPRATAPRPETAGMEELGGYMAPATAKVMKPAAMAAGRLAGQEINAAMTGQPTRSLLGDITPKPKNILPPAKFVGKSLEGLPAEVNVGGKVEQFGTDQRLVDLAKQYAADKGLTYNPQANYAQIDPERANRLANAYEIMANNPNDPNVKKAYNALVEETMAQYEALRKQGYKFDFMPESGDIYGNPRNAINDIVLNKHLSVFPTEQGFGGPSATAASEANPLLMRVGEQWGGKEVTANDLFRAVHDVFGHAKHGVGFRAGGEENAFQAHARMYSPEALPAATSETRGQNSWVNFGPFGQFNRTTNPALTEYAEQKTGLLPAWAWKEGISK